MTKNTYAFAILEPVTAHEVWTSSMIEEDLEEIRKETKISSGITFQFSRNFLSSQSEPAELVFSASQYLLLAGLCRSHL
jgi:hypothetical protein